MVSNEIYRSQVDPNASHAQMSCTIGI